MHKINIAGVSSFLFRTANINVPGITCRLVVELLAENSANIPAIRGWCFSHVNNVAFRLVGAPGQKQQQDESGGTHWTDFSRQCNRTQGQWSKNATGARHNPAPKSFTIRLAESGSFDSIKTFRKYLCNQKIKSQICGFGCCPLRN